MRASDLLPALPGAAGGATKIGTVNRDVNAPANENATVNATVKLTSTEQAIIKAVSKDGNITTETIAAQTGKDIVTIKRAIKSLRGKGIVERIGSDKSGHWIVSKKIHNFKTQELIKIF